MKNVIVTGVIKNKFYTFHISLRGLTDDDVLNFENALLIAQNSQFDKHRICQVSDLRTCGYRIGPRRSTRMKHPEDITISLKKPPHPLYPTRKQLKKSTWATHTQKEQTNA